jgi:hypothetical protein
MQFHKLCFRITEYYIQHVERAIKIWNGLKKLFLLPHFNENEKLFNLEIKLECKFKPRF